MNNNVQIFFPMYDGLRKKDYLFDASPIDVTNENPLLREYSAFFKILDNIDSINAEYIGLFSPKFCKKMRVSLYEVRRTVEQNPGYDFFTFNPYPCESYLFFNQWKSAAFYHPGSTDLASNIFKYVGWENIEYEPRSTVFDSVYCNFWVAKIDAFIGYVSFLKEIYENMNKITPALFELTLHNKIVQLPHWLFIFERLLPTYLRNKKINRYSFLVNEEAWGYMLPDDSSEDFQKMRKQYIAVKSEIDYLDSKSLNLNDYVSEFDLIQKKNYMSNGVF